MKDLDAILTSLIGTTREPRPGDSASFDAVLRRAEPFEDPVLAYLRKEEVWSEGVYEAVEERLLGRLEGVTPAGTEPTAGNDALVSDESVVPHGRWDALEERLMQRIAVAPMAQKGEEPAAAVRRYVWPAMSILSAITRFKPVHAVLIATLAVMAGLAVILPRTVPAGLTTTIIQAWGSAYRSDLGVPIIQGSTIASSSGGSLSLRNTAGTVSLDGDATLTIARADNRSAEYRVFTAADRRSGRIAFSVGKRMKNQKFVVVTPWYEIHVVGTRFVLEQEHGGALATTITEGRVRIVSPGVSDLYVDAGQTFSMDAAHKAWRVESARTLDFQFASAPDGSGDGRLTIVSTPSDAEVYIDNVYRGITPYAALLPRGTVTLSVRHEGYAEKDTTVTFGEGTAAFNVALALDADSENDSAAQVANSPVTLQKAATVQQKQKIFQDTVVDSAAMAAAEHAARVAQVRRALDSAQQSEAAHWKSAIDIYNRIAADLEAPPLYRQTALFSLGRLEADRLKDTSAAIRDFSEFCILYPDGVFTGEALLRLAELEITRNPASAIDYFQRFLLADPRHPRRADVAYHLGLLLQQRNNYGEAIRIYTIALEQLGERAIKRRAEITQMKAAAEAARSLSKSGK
jgi:tetratricopeptide (TPR) repeat protein